MHLRLQALSLLAICVTALGQTQGRAGDIEVTIKPDRTSWKLRESITGVLSIRNTGPAKIRLPTFWVDSVGVVDAAGKQPPSFSILGCILPAPNAPAFVELGPGEEHHGNFTVYTDRQHSMVNGFYLNAGRWWLTYPSVTLDSVHVSVVLPAIDVVVAPREYTGPRIQSVRAAGPNVVLIREDGSVNVVDGVSGKYLGTRRPQAFVPNWSWNGANLVVSSDGLLSACSADRQSGVVVETLTGPPSQRDLLPPVGVEVGQGGYFAQRFSSDDRELYCATNDHLFLIDAASGGLKRDIRLPAMWADISPTASYAACNSKLNLRLVGSRGSNAYSVRVFRLGEPVTESKVKVQGHGENPVLQMGLNGVYACDEFEQSVVYIPYSGGEPRSFKTDGGGADFVGETTDGSIVAFAWPWSERGQSRIPTTIAAYRVSDGIRLCEIDTKDTRDAILLSSPPRIVSFPRVFTTDESMWGGGHWLEEVATVYDATNGAELKHLDLTPPQGVLPETKP